MHHVTKIKSGCRYGAGLSLRSGKLRSSKAVSIAEACAVMALSIPLLMLIVMVVIQFSEYFIIKQQLAYVARSVAYEVANGYGKSGLKSMNSGGNASGTANTSDPSYQEIVNNIAVPGVININSGGQFATSFVIPNSPSLSQSYVRCVVTYKNGTGLPQFPWNPLHADFNSYNPGSMKVISSASWPIPHP